ncbi:MAG: TlpA family protein disulfide reductase [Planctomycetia bacterium]|nr:TlpA family protein disulfide reductase [Planctomycetia bacterium]
MPLAPHTVAMPIIASAHARFRLAASACLAAAVVAGCGEPTAHPAVGKKLGPLPVAPLADLTAPPPALAGRVTLLNFWGTWCPPCRRELPGLARMAAGLAHEPRFQLVAVCTSKFLMREKLTVPAYVFSDPPAADLLATTLGLEALPATYLIGPDATVRHVWIGYRARDEAEIAAAIVQLLR